MHLFFDFYRQGANNFQTKIRNKNMETIEFSKLSGRLNIKEIKKKNNKKIFKYWRPITFIMILKILQSFLKSFLFLFVSFSALKNESIPYSSGMSNIKFKMSNITEQMKNVVLFVSFIGFKNL